MGIFALIAFGIAGFSGMVFYAHQARKKRTEAMSAVAERLGLAFQPHPPVSIIPDARRFELFSAGHGRDIRNFMSLQKDGRTVCVFDYTYVTGAGKTQSAHAQTVVHVRCPGLNLPAFTLRPEHALHRLGGIFGYQDIDFDTDPQFSDAYLLRGTDEDAIRAAFTAPVLEFYDAHPKSCTEGNGAELLLWRDMKILEPNEIQALMQTADTLVNRFLGQPAA
ncbi:MAG TPA: hypothetical protein VF665_11350 [Longimicrobium sp.]|jgi:hypothetical protein|uniref:hypothetical protein n=1 Tax=Longimicrobium sp. TaxID=2029185 RepID=UPI002ED8D8BE